MFPEGNVWSTFIFLFLLTIGVPAEKICSVHSNQEVLMGSSFTIYCIFKKECNKLVYQDEMVVSGSSWNSTVAIMNIVNLTRTTTFTCKCVNEPEPCGTDIVPGYPPAVPQNLTCIQEGEYGNVNCTWKTGRETHIKTTSHLWVQGEPSVRYKSVPVHDGTHSAVFPVSGSERKFSVWVQARNSLNSANSTVLSFTLNEIVKPLIPKITEVKCSSRQCWLYPNNTQNVQLVEIRYRENQDSWSTVSLNNSNSQTSWTIPSLNPYSTYTFEVRWKFGAARGLWSEWTRVKNKTDEEAPVAMLDAWYIEEPTQKVTKSYQIFWRELKKSEARGKILQYNVTVMGKETRNTSTIKNTTTVSCFPCNVSISAMNSKGQSPARLIQLQPIEILQSYHVSHTVVSNHSVALSWPSRDGADPVTEVLVEWFAVSWKPVLQWIRVGRDRNTALITGLQPSQCYEGAVVYLHSSRTKKVTFSGISTWQTAPLQSPKSNIAVKSDSVEVKWKEIPLKKRGGCLKHYTINLKNSEDKIQTYNERPVVLLSAVGGVVFFTCLCLLCLCQFSLVHRRLSGCCHCLMPSIVPDPANSKWAKECTSEKGEMKLQLHLSDWSMSEKEPDTVEVEEFPHCPEDETVSPEETLLPVQSESAPYQHNIPSSYLKSFSNESSSSDATQASRSTGITVDYISTHGAISGGEEEDNEDEEEEEEEDGDEEDKFGFKFFPCPKSPFLDPLISIGGKLTLDSVKIDCSDFLDCA
ncbi:interleukin-12 receptor subunit beta-2 isoform 2-T2 [Clarias gariepinus]|uniref:interleukin-12 receptor subunit beta-2 isoform X2 n=1 Tax=Clarias gariepinus TaxID=13013 RepID=UPI00234D359B|nr:interleukin-12 receptor subunit beta-2 isoform X2 [Clarias gariepinus]